VIRAFPAVVPMCTVRESWIVKPFVTGKIENADVLAVLDEQDVPPLALVALAVAERAAHDAHPATGAKNIGRIIDVEDPRTRLPSSHSPLSTARQRARTAPARTVSYDGLIAAFAQVPGLVDVLLAEHVDDGSSRCRLCTLGGQAGYQRWPCRLHQLDMAARARQYGPQRPKSSR
jgi:hypothetical protein